ncbi:helix-turn-helix domain-containing protein [Salipaludibacillus sp. CF4.18]|uniref:helix-turn-helix domain-containing protein n=1 Tax=Salipaludibacillus sp. CF4.18 TaxID=3373081 RepID=UPI003EE4A092
MSFTGQRIKSLRDKKDWSQLFLAEKVGINNSVLSRIESGKRPVEDHEINKFADVFEVTTDYLMGRTDKPTYEPERQLDENLFFYDKGNITEEEMEELKKHLEFLRYKAAQENKKK